MSNPLYTVADVFVVFQILVVFLFIFVNYKTKILDYLVSLLLTISVSEGLKFLIHKQRPVMDLEGGSFPSTHTSVVFNAVFFVLFACHTLARNINREGKWSLIVKAFESMTKKQFLSILFLLAIVIGALRVFSGAHYIIDVIAGGLFGLSTAVIFRYYDVSARKLK